MLNRSIYIYQNNLISVYIFLLYFLSKKEKIYSTTLIGYYIQDFLIFHCYLHRLNLIYLLLFYNIYGYRIYYQYDIFFILY